MLTCLQICAGLHKLFYESEDGSTACDALQEYKMHKKSPGALITMSALDINGWNSMTNREVELLRPVLHAAESIFDPACAALFATDPGAAVVPSALREEGEEEMEEALIASGSMLCLLAVDKLYPVLPSIRALLPADECLLKKVLSNPEAAKAIMHLGDTEYCIKDLEAHGWNGDQHISVMLDGESMKLPDMTAIDLKIWLDMRDISTTNLGVGALKGAVLKRVKYSTCDELSRAKARLVNVVKDFQRV